MRASLRCGAAAVALALTSACASAPAPHPIVAAAPDGPPSAEASAAVPSQPVGTAPASEDSQATRSHETSSHHRRQMNRVWGWVSLAVGVEGTGVALATSVMMLHQNDIRKSNCTDKVCSAAGYNANKELASLNPWNIGGWVVGVAGLGIGTWLLLTNPSDKELGVQVGLTPGGMQVRGAFR